jgi:hypothetical protein
MMTDGWTAATGGKKSDAALRRENHAKALFDGFLQEAESMTTFPVTTDELVPASVHLTDLCWKSFTEDVVDKGCTTKRRLATAVLVLLERIHSSFPIVAYRLAKKCFSLQTRRCCRFFVDRRRRQRVMTNDCWKSLIISHFLVRVADAKHVFVGRQQPSVVFQDWQQAVDGIDPKLADPV